MEYEEVIVDGQVVKIATKVDPEENSDYDLEESKSEEMLGDTLDLTTIFEETQEININES